MAKKKGGKEKPK